MYINKHLSLYIVQTHIYIYCSNVNVYTYVLTFEQYALTRSSVGPPVLVGD